MNETQEQARVAIKNIATGWNRGDEMRKKEQGFVGIGTFEERVTGQYAFSDKDLREEKSFRKRVETGERISSVGSFMTRGIPKKAPRARKNLSWGTMSHERKRIL